MLEVTLYEPDIPGKLIGKLVVDKRGRVIGVAFAVKVVVPPGKCLLLVKGRHFLEVPLSEVEVGPNIKLKSEVDMPEIDLTTATRILKLLKDEMLMVLYSSELDD